MHALIAITLILAILASIYTVAKYDTAQQMQLAATSAELNAIKCDMAKLQRELNNALEMNKATLDHFMASVEDQLAKLNNTNTNAIEQKPVPVNKPRDLPDIDSFSIFNCATGNCLADTNIRQLVNYVNQLYLVITGFRGESSFIPGVFPISSIHCTLVHNDKGTKRTYLDVNDRLCKDFVANTLAYNIGSYHNGCESYKILVVFKSNDDYCYSYYDNVKIDSTCGNTMTAEYYRWLKVYPIIFTKMPALYYTKGEYFGNVYQQKK